jgi:cytochrome c-type biogenesis protein CcmF
MEKDVWQKYRSRGLAVLGINTAEQGDPEKLARQWVAEHEVTYPTVLDTEGDVSLAYEVNALPSIAVIDRKGVLRYLQPGFDEAAVVKLVEQLLAEGS